MAKALTTASIVTCLHNGPVTFTGQTRLRVAGAPVLVAPDPLADGTSIACLNSGTGVTPCRHITELTGGVGKLRAAGRPVLLDSLAGKTDGKVAGVFQTLNPPIANQPKLTGQ